MFAQHHAGRRVVSELRVEVEAELAEEFLRSRQVFTGKLTNIFVVCVLMGFSWAVTLFSSISNKRRTKRTIQDIHRSS
jgi:hypothetical protein